MPKFTQDWFSNNILSLSEMLARVPSKKAFLEIGSFEGMSACWFLKNHLAEDGRLVCIDTFNGGAEHVSTTFVGVADRCRANTEEVRKPNQVVEIMEMTSVLALAKLIDGGEQFDFIYVDGSHTTPDVLMDATMCLQLLKVGGVMVFDDYMWDMHKPVLETPKLALDLFTSIYRDQVDIIMLSYQLGVIKTK